MNYLPALLSQTSNPSAVADMGDTSILKMVFSSGPVVQSVLFILIFFSIASWAIIFFKYLQLKRAKKSAAKFSQTFDNAYSIDEILTKPAPQDGNPLYNIFSSGMSDILRFKQIKAKDPNSNFDLRIDHIHRKIRQAQNDQTHRLEQLTPFLATTASACPFIGLFGTVWGILSAFFTIGQQKTTSLAVVGPYIAEALVATAVGLAAAIPAVIAYNYFVTRIKALAKSLGDFSTDLEHRIEREYF